MKDTQFLLGVSFGLVGWVLFGLGVVLFPLSLFFIMRSSHRPPFFALLVINGITGFSLSLYFVSQYIAEHIL